MIELLVFCCFLFSELIAGIIPDFDVNMVKIVLDE